MDPPPSTRKPPCDMMMMRCYEGKRPSSSSCRRIPSFSSSTSSSSSSVDESFVGPATPLRFISRIPFSWEHFPGIPKNPNMNILASPSHKLLPPPPPTATVRSNKSFIQRDPFFAAFVKCSKSKNYHNQHHHHEAASSTTSSAGGGNSNSNTSLWNNNTSNKVSRSLSGRFELVNLFASCKRTCAVSESMVHLPTSRRTS